MDVPFFNAIFHFPCFRRLEQHRLIIQSSWKARLHLLPSSPTQSECECSVASLITLINYQLPSRESVATLPVGRLQVGNAHYTRRCTQRPVAPFGFWRTFNFTPSGMRVASSLRPAVWLFAVVRLLKTMAIIRDACPVAATVVRSRQSSSVHAWTGRIRRGGASTRSIIRQFLFFFLVLSTFCNFFCACVISILLTFFWFFAGVHRYITAFSIRRVGVFCCSLVSEMNFPLNRLNASSD